MFKYHVRALMYTTDFTSSYISAVYTGVHRKGESGGVLRILSKRWRGTLNIKYSQREELNPQTLPLCKGLCVCACQSLKGIIIF